jgi:catechol 2,3-dioxygenase-like lactoylglutathione lyase family enzyme
MVEVTFGVGELSHPSLTGERPAGITMMPGPFGAPDLGSGHGRPGPSGYRGGRCRSVVPSRPAPREFGLLGFDHVDIRVRDRAKAKRFFVEQLGMDVIGEGPDHTLLLFGDQVLGLRDAKEGETLGGVDHLALRVSEWTGLRSRVGRARVVITGEKEREDSRSLFLRGPEGMRIELVWRPDPHSHACSHAQALVVPAPDPEE